MDQVRPNARKPTPGPSFKQNIRITVELIFIMKKMLRWRQMEVHFDRGRDPN
jgi:hypothetical protein